MPGVGSKRTHPEPSNHSSGHACASRGRTVKAPASAASPNGSSASADPSGAAPVAGR